MELRVLCKQQSTNVRDYNRLEQVSSNAHIRKMLWEHREEAIREISKVLQSWYGELGLEIKRSLGEAEHCRKEKKKSS